MPSAPSKAQIRKIFEHLEVPDPQAFYGNFVADDVQWKVMGSHKLSGVYKSKVEFLETSASRIMGAMARPIKLVVVNVIGGEPDEWAVVEMVADGKLKSGKPYNNRYSWTTRWKDGKIVEVRAYLDGLMLNNALLENEKPGN